MLSLHVRHGARENICAQNFILIYSTVLGLLTRRNLQLQIDSYQELLGPKVATLNIEIREIFAIFKVFQKLAGLKLLHFWFISKNLFKLTCFDIFWTFLSKKIFFEFLTFLAIFGMCTFSSRFFALKESKWRLLVKTLVKDNPLNFQKIGRNLKFDFGKAFKFGIKVRLLNAKILHFGAHWRPWRTLDWQFFTSNSCPDLSPIQCNRFWDLNIFFMALGSRKQSKNDQKWPFWAIFSTYDVIMTS